MSKLTFTDPQGRTLQVDSPDGSIPSESELDQMFSMKYGAVAETEPTEPTAQMTPSERLAGGFMGKGKLKEFQTTRRQERGLQEGTPLEPVGFNVENLKDFPNDVLDAVGPSLPAFGQFISALGTAAVTRSPQASIAAGAAGSAGGEAVRQFIGQAAGLPQDTGAKRVGQIGTEAAIGATGEAIGLTVGQTLKLMKSGLVKLASKSMDEGWFDKFVEGFGKIGPGAGVKETSYAIQSVKKGNEQVLSNAFASERFPLDVADEVIYGGTGRSLVDNIGRYNRRRANKTSVTALMKEFAGVPEELTDQVFSNQARITQRLKNPNYINDLLSTTSNKLNSAKKFEMNLFGDALEKSMIRNQNKLVKLTDINERFISDLKGVGILTDSGELNQAFKGSGLAKVVERMLGQFGKSERATGRLAELKGAELSEAIANLGKGKYYSPEKVMNFRSLTQLWKSERNAITKDIFQTYEPKVTRPLAIYFDKVGERLARVGGMESANARYGKFMQVFRPIEEAISEPITARRFLGSLNRDSIRQLGIDQLEARMPNQLRFSDDVLNFNAVQKLTKMDSPVVRASVQKRMAAFMDSVFSDTPTAAPRAELVESIIDQGLPEYLRLTERAKIHASAKALHKSAFSILRARFLSSGVGVPMLIGATTGGIVGGAPGALGGLGVGFALQDPRILRALIKLSASPSGRVLKDALSIVPTQPPPVSGSLLSALLRLAGAEAQT